jgi:hypothetical protein
MDKLDIDMDMDKNMEIKMVMGMEMEMDMDMDADKDKDMDWDMDLMSTSLCHRQATFEIGFRSLFRNCGQLKPPYGPIGIP